MGQLQLNISDHKIIYVDSCIIIYTVEKIPEYSQLLQPIWQKLAQDEIEIITSELTFMECLVLPLKLNNNRLIMAYQNILSTTKIKLQPISLPILRDGANLRAKSKIKTADAIHIATALSLNCDLFLTNDLGLKNIPNLSTIVLREVIKSCYSEQTIIEN
jgi:predicted nucleic acid-binding protein